MRLAQAIRVGSRCLVGLNLLMAVGTIAIFTRMAPAIAFIIEHNERTLKACEDMLAVMAVTGVGSPFSDDRPEFFKQPLTGQRRILPNRRSRKSSSGWNQHFLPCFKATLRFARKLSKLLSSLAKSIEMP